MRRLTYIMQTLAASAALLAFVAALWAAHQHRAWLMVWNCGLMITNAGIFVWQRWIREQLGPDPSDVDDEPIH